MNVAICFHRKKECDFLAAVRCIELHFKSVALIYICRKKKKNPNKCEKYMMPLCLKILCCAVYASLGIFLQTAGNFSG